MLAPELNQKQQTEVITQGPSSFSVSELRNFSNHKLPINMEPSTPPTHVLPAGPLGFPPPLSIIFLAIHFSFLTPQLHTRSKERWMVIFTVLWRSGGHDVWRDASHPSFSTALYTIQLFYNKHTALYSWSQPHTPLPGTQKHIRYYGFTYHCVLPF